MDKPDILYVYKHSGNGDELRYSLRSLKNIPHRFVFLSGDKPDWVSDAVIHIPNQEYDWAIMGNRFANAEAKWRAALEDERLSTDFIAMNDDFFFMEPMKELRMYQRDTPLPFKDTSTNYQVMLSKTREYLYRHNVNSPKNYELHVPMPMHKIKRLAISYLLQEDFRRGQIVMPRSIYGNVFRVEGKKIEDPKNVPLKRVEEFNFLSTDSGSFAGELGTYIKSRFPDKSIYEK